MEGPQNQRNSTANKFCIISSFCTLIIFIFFIIYQIFNSIWLIKKQYIIMDTVLFKKICLYKELFNIYKEFNFFVICIDLIILMIASFDWNYYIGIFIDNFTDAFLYFNYLYFGPFLFGVVILLMKYGNEITFIYDQKLKRNIALDYKNISIIFIYIFISFTIAIICPIFYAFNYFNDSIKFKRYGNYLLGRLFWYFALKYSDDLYLRINNNNIGNGGNQNGQEFPNEQDIQNNIFPFNELLDNNIDFID